MGLNEVIAQVQGASAHGQPMVPDGDAAPSPSSLAASLQRCDVQPQAFGTVAQNLANARTGAGQVVTQAERAGGELTADWGGDAALAFNDYLGRFRRAGAEMDQLLIDVEQHVNDLEQAMQRLREAGAELGEQFVAAVNQLIIDAEDDGGLDQEELARAIAALEQAMRQEADERVNIAEEEVATIISLVRDRTEHAAPFSQLPLPDTSGPAEPATIQQVSYNGGSSGGGGATGGSGPLGGFGDGTGDSTGSAGSPGSAGIGPSGGPPATPPPGDVHSWILRALDIMGMPASEANINMIWTVISHESGGDPNAINLWDSNAAQGIPSKGLMQTIDPTFNAHALPGHTDIWNPVDNIIAGVRYTIDRYGSLANHPGIASLNSGGGYQPY